MEMIWIIYLLIIFFFILATFLINFYRNPERKIPLGKNIVSPADGKIIKIIKLKNSSDLIIKKPIFGKIKAITRGLSNDLFIISIFMSPFDVHYNRAPIDGAIKEIRYLRGRFFPANNFQKSLYNEKNEILINNNDIGNIKVIQIAGFLARKIRCNVKENQKVSKGQIIGSIVLGSQVSLLIPCKVKLTIKIGSKVKAGETIIGYY